MKVRNKLAEDVVIAPAGRNPISVEAGDVVEVDDDLAVSLLDQPDRWEPADNKKTAAAVQKEG